eukprot:g51762.t1
MASAKVLRDYSRWLSPRSLLRTPSPIRALQPLLAVPGVISLGGGMPNPSTFPFQSISVTLQPLPSSSSSSRSFPAASSASGATTASAQSPIVLSLTPQQTAEALQYSATTGLPGLVKHLQALQMAEHAPPCLAAGERPRLHVTTGSQDALSKAFEMVVAPGDNLLCEEPTYSGSLAFLKTLGCNLVGVPTDGDGLNPDKLHDILAAWGNRPGRPKVLYTVPTGANPSGGTMTLERKIKLYKVAREYDLLILEDDPYYYLQFPEPGQRRVRSLYSLDQDGRVLRFDSFSKLVSSGLRVGFVTGPTPLVERIELHSQATTLHSSGVSQALLSCLLDHWAKTAGDGKDCKAGFEQHVGQVSDFYRARRDFFCDRAAKHLEGLAEFSRPSAGMFVWFKLLGVADSAPLIQQKAVDKKVVLVPGKAFALHEDAPSSYVRAAFSTASYEQMDEALRRLAELLREHRASSRL